MGATLTVTSSSGVRGYPIEGTLTIGRAPDNEVILESLDVSRHHASLMPGSSGLVFLDLGSANGSKVNGREVEPRVPIAVRPGDSITVADVALVLGDSGVAAAGSGPGATIVAGASAAPAAPPGATVVAPPPSARLEITTRAGSREVNLEGSEVAVGRETDNQIVIPEDVVSRHHFVLRRTGDTYTATDLGATNGISVGGVRVQSHVLRDGDVLTIGDGVALRFRLAAAIPAVEGEQPQDQEVRLAGRQTITIGRAASCDLQLTHPTISQRHAQLSMTSGQRLIQDLGSTNGTFVNGVRLARGESRVLAPTDVIQVGPIRLHLSHEAIRREDSSQNIRLTALRLNQRVSERLNLLKDISVVVEPQEFVAVVGVSGSGKSTLLGALSGLRPATDGDVLLNDTSLYDHFQAFRTTLGYVPQDDILHRELPVARALAYAAELRLPDDTPETERLQRVEAVIQTLGLQERRETPIGQLSGGQRKRVSIGAELLTQPGLFFLDEATSGLDPGTESQLMRLLRKLADDGHTILLITHATKNVMLCDQVLFLARGGNLAYFGPPDQALAYFGVDDFDGIYEKLEGSEKSPEEWAATYRASRQYQEFVAARLAGQSGPTAPAGFSSMPRQVAPPAGRTSSALHQLRVLSARYFDLIRRDHVNFALLFLLAPALSLIDLVAWPRDVLDGKTGSGSTAMTMFFLGALIPFLIGSLSSVREIVKEAPIYARERAVSLKVWPYLGSKIAIGSLFALYHGAVLVAVKILWIRWPGVDAQGYFELYVTLVLAVISGVMWALLISTLTRREEQAMMLIIGLIVLQVVFSGGLVPLESLGPAGVVLGGITSTAWAFKALVAAGGLTVAGCTGDMSGCTLPGMAALNSPETKTLAYNGIDEKFGGVFDANIFVCWAGMAVLIVVLALALYVLQKRKDRL